MTIRVTCPNGHVLQVKDCFAGKTGLCPVCKAKVQVPELCGELSEDDIMGVLGPHNPSSEDHAPVAEAEPSGESASDSRVGSTSPPKKCCTNCNREISAGTHICPFCRTYIANLRDL